MAVDAAGNLFIADYANHRVRRVDAVTGVITTVAGTGVPDHNGDGIPATAANLGSPLGVAVDAAGNLFITETGNNRIRKVDAATGMITTVAGTGGPGYSGDGGPAAGAAVGFPRAMAVDAAGNLYIADANNSRIRKVDAATGVITTVAGTGGAGLRRGRRPGHRRRPARARSGWPWTPPATCSSPTNRTTGSGGWTRPPG